MPSKHTWKKNVSEASKQTRQPEQSKPSKHTNQKTQGNIIGRIFLFKSG